MTESHELISLLGVIISLLGRASFPEAELRKIVAPSKKSARLLHAYNLCDGTRTRVEVARAAGLDKDNFYKAVNRWLQAGVLFEVTVEKRALLRNLYPLSA